MGFNEVTCDLCDQVFQIGRTGWIHYGIFPLCLTCIGKVEKCSMKL